MSAHLILIDALNLIRRVYAVQERPFMKRKQQHGDKLSANTQEQVLFNTQKNCVNAVIKIIKQLEPTHALAVFDSQQPCWRYQIFAGYKKGRKKMPEHLAQKLTAIQDAFMEQGVDSLTSVEDEADDLIATLAVKMALHGQKVTIISTDKGFLPLLSPNIHLYDYFNRRYLDEEYVQQKFAIKSSQLIDFWTLTGDNTNKIAGVSGIGQVNAAKLINQYGSLKAIVNATDLKESLKEKLLQSDEQMALARKLLTLKKDIPLGFNLKDIRLTTPSSSPRINVDIIAINSDSNSL
ncbi:MULTISPECIES: flap endonuclease Xni [Colwellia]|uniref:Flap endonuclease Xni n=1 Tax=Colwellia marinimaniae TaxID=1513592 RepID=A0ABQ0MUM3_9GAMM|nr:MULTISPECIES: flap endonuclease Xni [Colwellia]GAW96055.1 Flap endonuclease Xni [Colwellia marinimaniae]